MDDLYDLYAPLDRLDRLSEAIELATKLEEILSPLMPRRSIRSTVYRDSVYSIAVTEACRLEDVFAATLRKVSEQRNMVLSPIFRLDDDIWQCVFLHVYNSTPSGTRARIRTSIALSHVCREFRRIALDTAGLWISRISDIPLLSEQRRVPPGNRVVVRERPWEADMAAAFSKRSKGALLEQTVHFFGGDSRLQLPLLRFGAVKALTANLNAPEDALHLLAMLPNSLDTLERLEMQPLSNEHADSTNFEWETPVWNDFAELFSSKVTKVQTLRLTRGSFSPLFEDLHRCEGILKACRSLDVYDLELSSVSIQNIVESSPALRSLKLTAELATDTPANVHPTSELVDTPANRRPPSFLLALEVLDLGMPARSLEMVMDSLSAPSLRALRLCSNRPFQTFDFPQHFLQSSTSRISELTLINIPSEDGCTTILANVTNLKSLTLRVWNAVFQPILDGLTPTNGTEVSAWCPHLETFIYEHWWLNTPMLGAFVRMVRARSNWNKSDPAKVSALRRLNVAWCRVRDEQQELIRELAFLLGPGLSLQGWRLDPQTMAWCYVPDEEEAST